MVKEFVRPESMKNMPESDSDSEAEDNEDEPKGITQCSLALGDGAALYLQMMKTFTIMFFLLSIVNIPIYIIYANSTQGNTL